MDSRVCYVSCVDSGPNPSPGLGVARSLREHYPDATLVAVAYSERTSGFHHSVFDDVWMNRPWDELDLDFYANQIAERVSESSLFLSNLDLETKWLARSLGSRPGLPVPPAPALDQVAKPEVAAATSLPVEVPPYLPVKRPNEDLHAFGRRHNWRCWLKGPSHEAVPITHWKDVEEARSDLEDRWGTSDLFLQAHRDGREESVLFCARRGELLGAVRMQKTRTTGASKTWAGRLTPLDDRFQSALADTVADLNWTGGAEIECIRDADDGLWVIDWNPRFPGWVYGATINGFNAPATLAAACWGDDRPLTSTLPSDRPAAFTRVVTEIPLRTPVPADDPGGDAVEDPFKDWGDAPSKVPTDMPALARRLRKEGPVDRERPAGRHANRAAPTASASPNGAPTPLDDDLRAVADDLPNPLPDSPASIVLPTETPKRFERFRRAAETVSRAYGGIPFRVAYSVKTNPHPALVDAAHNAGLWAETIHPEEIRHARDRGFDAGDIVLNGPFQHQLHDTLPSLRAAFADTLSDLAEMLQAENLPSVAGIRLRPSRPLSSRFGVDLTDPDVFDRCCDLVGSMPDDVRFGIHVHHASSTAGHDRWWNYLTGAMHWGTALQSETGQPVEVLDFGGGWHPDDWLDVFIPGLIDRAEKVLDAFPQLSGLIAEPGKALCQPLGVVLSRVVDVRTGSSDSDGHPSAVLDASIAELSNVDFHPHRIIARCDGDWYRVGRGDGTLYGRLCMEEDVLGSRVDVSRLSPGDPVVFCDAGAYDMSMTYPFGRGHTSVAPGAVTSSPVPDAPPADG